MAEQRSQEELIARARAAALAKETGGDQMEAANQASVDFTAEQEKLQNREEFEVGAEQRGLVEAIQEGRGDRPEAPTDLGPSPFDIIGQRYGQDMLDENGRLKVNLIGQNNSLYSFANNVLFTTFDTEDGTVPFEFAQAFQAEHLHQINEKLQLPAVDNIFIEDWQQPYNWTVMEMTSFQQGLPVDFIIELEAAQAAYDETTGGFIQAENRLAKNQQFMKLQFETSPEWMEFDRKYADAVGQEWLDALAFGMNTNVDQHRLNVLISELGNELDLRPDILASPKKLDALLARTMMRSQQLGAAFQTDLEMHENGDIPILTGLKNVGLGILDPLLTPLVNFEDEGIMTGMQQAFQPFEDLRDQIQSGISGYWAHSVDPDNIWRPNLTMGQNIAISAGTLPNTGWYSAMSGAFDLAGYIAFDPLTYAGGLAKGFSASRVIASTIGGSRANRILHGLKFALPGGRTAAGFGFKGAKSAGARFMYTAFGQTIDELLQPTTKLGTRTRAKKWADDVFEILHTPGKTVDDVFSKYEDLAQNADMVELFRHTDSSDEILEIVGEHMKGNMKPKKSIEVARRALDDANAQLSQRLVNAARTGTLDIVDVAGIKLSGQNAVRTYGLLALGDGLSETGVHKIRGKANGAGGEFFAWVKQPNIATPERLLKSKLFQTNALGSPVVNRFKQAMAQGEDLNVVLNSLDDFEIGQLQNFLSNAGFDVLFVNGDAVLGRDAIRKVIKVTDNGATGGAAATLGDVVTEKAFAEHAYRMATNVSDEVWWLDSIPNRVTVRKQAVNAIRRAGSEGKAGGWWQGFKQSQMARYAHAIPKQFEYFDTQKGVSQIRAHGRRAGVSENTINDWVARYTHTVPEERANFIGEMFTETAQQVGDFRMEYGIRRSFLDSSSVQYTLGDDGVEIARGQSKSAVGKTSGKPHQPSMLGTAHPGMDPEWYREMDRLRKAKALGTKTTSVQGTFMTGNKRQKLVQKYRTLLQQENINLAESGITDDDLYAMAFATVNGAATGGVDGLGAISTVMGHMGKAYGYMHRGFNLMALGMRPVTWPLKVVFGEESVRAQLAGLPNMLMHPNRHFRNVKESIHLRQAIAAKGAIGSAHTMARSTIITKLDDLTAVDDAIRQLDEFVGGNLRKLVDDSVGLADATIDDVRRIALDELDVAFADFSADLTFGGRINYSREAEKQIRLEQRGLKIIDAHGGGQTLDMLDDSYKALIGDLSHEVSTAHITSQGPVGRAPGTTKQYSVARMHEIVREANDPFTRFAADRAIAALKNHTPKRIETIMGTGHWRKMRRTVQDIAGQEGFKYANDVELATWYFDDFYRKEIMQPRFKHFMQDGTGVITMDSELDFWMHFRRRQLKLGDEVINLERKNQGALVKQYNQWLDSEMLRPDHLFEPAFANGAPGALEAIANEGIRKWAAMPANGLRRSVRMAGSDTTQAMTRRPGYMAIYDDYFKHYEGLGWPRERAAMAANKRAVAEINNLMYNMSDSPELLDKFNKIVPFGAAQYEVAKVWFWQLPVLQGGAGLGHITLLHKVQRFERGLEAMGIVRRDDEGNTFLDVSTEERLGQTPMGNIAGSLIASTFNVGGLMGQQLSQLRAELFSDEDYEASPLPKQYEMRLGNPLDPGGEGIFAMNRFGIGANPVASLALNYIADQSWLTSREVSITTEVGQTLEEFAKANGLEGAEALFETEANRIELRKMLGDEKYYAIMKDPDNFDLERIEVEAEHVFTIPNTGGARALFDATINPFGAPTDALDALRDFVPSTVQNMVRGFAIHEGNDDGVLAGLLGPLNVHNTDSGLLTGMAYANMTGGYIDDALEFVQQAADERQKMVDDGLAMYQDDGTIVPTMGADLAEFTRRNNAVLKLEDEAHEAEMAATEQAVSYAAQQQMMRAFTGFLIPGSPRAFTEEQLRVNELWDGRALADAIKEGEGDAAWQKFLTRPHENLASAMRSVAIWFENDTSSEAKQAWAEYHPGLEMFITPKRVYNGTPFPEFSDDDIGEYVASIQRGEVQTVSPDVFVQRYWNTRVTWEDRANKKAISGHDTGWAQGQWAIANWTEWSEASAETRMKRNALKLYDAEYMGGAYAKTREVEHEHSWGISSADQKAFDDALYAQERRIDEIDQQISTLDQDVIDPADREEMRDALWAERRMVKDYVDGQRQLKEFHDYGDETDDFISAYFDGVYGPYKGEKQLIWDELNDTTRDLTPEQRSTLYQQIRDIENKTYFTEPTIYGLTVPNPIKWVEGLRSPEDWDRRRYAALYKRPDWLHIGETRDLMGNAVRKAIENGGAEDDVKIVLPRTLEEMEPFTRYSQQLTRLKDQFENPQSPEEVLTPHQYKLHKDALEEDLRKELGALDVQNEMAEFMFDYTPAERVQSLGLLDMALNPIMDATTKYLGNLPYNSDGTQKGPKSNDGDRIWKTTYWPVIEDMIAKNGDIRAALQTLGANTMGESDPRKVVERLFLDIFI